jgi:hypothetical protein
MHHQFVGRPIGKVDSASLETSDGLKLSSAGKTYIYADRVLNVVKAIWSDEVDGEIYADGEVWADPQSVTVFLAQHIPA